MDNNLKVKNMTKKFPLGLLAAFIILTVLTAGYVRPASVEKNEFLKFNEILAQGDWDIIISEAEKLRLKTNEPGTLDFILSVGYFLKGNFALKNSYKETALNDEECFAEISGFLDGQLEKYPKSATLHILKGILLGTGKISESEKFLKKAVKHSEKYGSDINFFKTYFETNLNYDSIKRYEGIVELNPLDAVGHYNLALTYQESGYLMKAEQRYKKALDLKLTVPEIYNNLGLIYMARGILAKSKEFFEKAVSSDFKFQPAYYNLGVLYIKLEDYTSAIASFKKAIDLVPADAQAMINLGFAYKKKGYSEDAKIMYYRALKSDKKILKGIETEKIFMKMEDIPLQGKISKPIKMKYIEQQGADDSGDMVSVAEGEFIFGTNSGLENEAPARRIYLKKFYIDKHEVTNKKYEEFIAATRYKAPVDWIKNKPPAELLYHPVSNVSYNDALAYAKWCGKRLPTEVEWEKAAKGTGARIYPWGDVFDEEKANVLRKFSRSGTVSADEYPGGVSFYGCYNMAGNVWEWTSSDSEGLKVVRGGSFAKSPLSARTTTRETMHPDEFASDVGFRCAKD